MNTWRGVKGGFESCIFWASVVMSAGILCNDFQSYYKLNKFIMSVWQLQTAQNVMVQACAPDAPDAPFQPLACMQASYNYGTLSATSKVDAMKREPGLVEMRDMILPVSQPTHGQVISALGYVGKTLPSNQFCSSVPRS